MKKPYQSRSSGGQSWGGASKGKGGKTWNRGGSHGPREGGSERPAMHHATCAKCNKSCEVPFVPTGSKPIYCRDCFKHEDGDAPKRFSDRGDRSSRESHSSMSFDDNKRSFSKPEYSRGERGSDQPMTNEQFRMLNTKLDAILNALANLE